MVQTGHEIEDIGQSISWTALSSFLARLDISSETARELEPDLAKWSDTVKTNAILADIYDMLAMINANIVSMNSGKRAKKPAAYPRPGNQKKEKIGGKNALPPEQLREWFNRKRKSRE